MSEVFNHTEQPTQRLLDRHDQLITNMESVNYTGERRRAIEHELSCIVCELVFRTLEEDMPEMELEIPMGLLPVLYSEDVDIESID